MTGKAWTVCFVGLLVGQLPFDVVITRGGTLQGLYSPR